MASIGNRLEPIPDRGWQFCQAISQCGHDALPVTRRAPRHLWQSIQEWYRQLLHRATSLTTKALHLMKGQQRWPIWQKLCQAGTWYAPATTPHKPLGIPPPHPPYSPTARRGKPRNLPVHAGQIAWQRLHEGCLPRRHRHWHAATHPTGRTTITQKDRSTATSYIRRATCQIGMEKFLKKWRPAQVGAVAEPYLPGHPLPRNHRLGPFKS